MADDEWTVGRLKEHLQQISDERDRRYEQRFEAQERAVAAALAAQEKAVSAALGAAERAVLKAEVAAEKRFESQNEFRGQLSDQAARQMPRAEANVEFSNIREKIDGLAVRIASIEKRLAGGEGVTAGKAFGWERLVSLAGLLGALIAIFAWLSKGL